MRNYIDKTVSDLFKAILSLSSSKEATAFFRDLCTLAEIKNMAERWQIVLLLQTGIPYREIANKLNTSTATITRVAGWLNNGSGGYQTILRKLSHHNSTSRLGKV